MKFNLCTHIAVFTIALAGGLAGANAAESPDAATAWKSAQQYVPGLSKDIVDGACREGSVMLYSLVLQSSAGDIFDQFQKRFPCVSLKKFAASGGALAQRFTSEFNAGTYTADLWMNSSPLFGNKLASQGVLLHWTPPTASRISDSWKKEGYWYALGLGPIGVAWNTQEVTKEQKKWLDNLKTWDQVPSAPFAGSSALVDIRAGGTTQLPNYFFTTTYGPGYLNKIAALKPTVFSGINPLVGRLVAGEFAFAVAVPGDTAVANQWLNGAPLQWKYPEPGLAIPYFMAISAKAKHPDAAKLFLAWSLSRDGQTAWVKGAGFAPASDVTDERLYAKQAWYKLPKKYYRADWDAIGGQLKQDIKKFDAVFGK